MAERIILKNGDVISMNEEKNITYNPTSKVSEVMEQINGAVRNDELQQWFNSGVNCEVLLCNGAGWTKGRVRFVCEFIPDEKPAIKARELSPKQDSVGSTLDDLREQLDL